MQACEYLRRGQYGRGIVLSATERCGLAVVSVRSQIDSHIHETVVVQQKCVIVHALMFSNFYSVSHLVVFALLGSAVISE